MPALAFQNKILLSYSQVKSFDHQKRSVDFFLALVTHVVTYDPRTILMSR